MARRRGTEEFDIEVAYVWWAEWKNRTERKNHEAKFSRCEGCFIAICIGKRSGTLTRENRRLAGHAGENQHAGAVTFQSQFAAHTLDFDG